MLKEEIESAETDAKPVANPGGGGVVQRFLLISNRREWYRLPWLRLHHLGFKRPQTPTFKGDTYIQFSLPCHSLPAINLP